MVAVCDWLAKGAGTFARITVLAAAIAAGSAPAAAGARLLQTSPHQFGTISQYALPGCGGCEPIGIAPGYRHDLWFSTFLPGAVYRMDLAGGLTAFPVGGNNYGIAHGLRGRMWFASRADGGSIGWIDENGVSGTALKGYDPLFLAPGPAGSMWFSDFSGAIGALPFGTHKAATFQLPAGHSPEQLVAGPDGNVWFTEETQSYPNVIGRLTPSGQLTEFPLPGQDNDVNGIAVGSDGNLWFTASNATDTQGLIGRCTTSGQITMFPVPNADPYLWGIAAGPDDDLYFTDLAGAIGRISLPSVTITEYAVPNEYGSSVPLDIVMGADKNMWFTLPGVGAVGRFATR